MLELIHCSGLEDKNARFAQVDFTRDTWVVSDLQSKWHLQKELLARKGVLEQSSILRATELWKQLAFRVRPELKLLSPELAQTLFWNWIKPMDLPWAQSPHAVRVVLQQMQMWMTVFSDPRHAELMPQWFADNGEAYVRWGHWFELCAELWSRCQERDLVMTNWLPAVLLGEDLSRVHWPKTLTFDLGAQVSQVEALLIKELAREHEVRVLVPDAPWAGLMRNAMRPYEVLMDQTYQVQPEWQPPVQDEMSFGRFSTQLAEVKDAVARVRAWLDSGVNPQAIAVVAPDIEAYWPALSLYCAEEGVPVGKAVTARLGSFTEMAQWLAALRTALSKLSSHDLEVHAFAGQDSPRISYDEFRVLFTNVYDSGDLQRASAVFESAARLDPDTPLPAADFVAWTLNAWSGKAEPQRLLHLLQVIGQEVPEDLSLEPAQWLSYVEGLLARRELTLQSAEEGGVWCVSVSSADWLPATHAIFLGLSENALRSVESSPVSAAEGQKLFADTGYAVGTTDRQELEFEFLWFLNRAWRELRLTFAGTDFQGKVLTPSRLWMWAAFTNEQFKDAPEAPLQTRWDEVQRLELPTLAELRGYAVDRTLGTSFALARDIDVNHISWKPQAGERASASSLERYWTCSFMFAAERRLKLNDDPVLDLDLDRRTRGSLLHALVDALASPPMRLDWSEDELLTLIDQVRLKEEITIGEERLWPAVRAQHVRLAQRFLQLEHEWRQRFPTTETVAREASFQCSWDLERHQPIPAGGHITLSGRIDRVDRDSRGRYVLIDYKASSATCRNWKSWLGNKDIQLALYTQLLEHGLVDGLAPGQVMAANYYVVKDGERRKGFHLRDDSAELYSAADKHLNFISEDEKTGLYREMGVLISQALQEMLAGQFAPKPEDEKSCSGCRWRGLCRAPHLN